MLFSIIKWVAFVWETLAVSVMYYFATIWLPHAPDSRYNEMAIGFTCGAFYGWPSWLALPAFAVAQRKELPRWQVMLFAAPVCLAVALYVFAYLLARGIF